MVRQERSKERLLGRSRSGLGSNGAKDGRRLRIFGRDMPLPATRRSRIMLGIGLVAGGILGFLPILGFWMIPLGVVVLSMDVASIRRWRRKAELRWGRWRQRHARHRQG